jgi:hypothetical protein cdiviTM7_00321
MSKRVDIEIPLGKRTFKYRFFEILPASLSFGAIILMFILSAFSPFLASLYLLTIITTLLVKAIGIAYRMITGHLQIEKAQKVDWNKRLNELENSEKSLDILKNQRNNEYEFKNHLQNLNDIIENPASFPKPSKVKNAVIIAAYNEPYEVIQPTIQSVLVSNYDAKNLLIFLAYEERGGEEIEKTAIRLKKEFSKSFGVFEIVKHPKNLPNEVVGKGGNITFAGRALQKYCENNKIPFENVLVTTLDSDNKPHKEYFACATYSFIVHEDRKRLSYQPVSLFLNNIWDVPAPMRVVATGNSFWNIVSTMRPHLLRNFASHSQPLDALVEMDFWSTRTIVEDGHQFWRSYFHFGGDYYVVPIRVPIYQDAVLSETLPKTLKAQFIQLRRWMYGASDIPYVANLYFSKNRNVPIVDGLMKLIRLIDGHVTAVFQSPMAAFGGWVPLIVYAASSRSVIVHQLPNVISTLQQVATVGIFITILISLKMLPPRPERYKKRRSLWMVAQWVYMPVTSICYNAAAAAYSQTRLAFGKYLDKFDVTEKGRIEDVERAKAERAKKRALKKQKK